MKNALVKDSVKEIKCTFKRFLSILLMSLLGVVFFAGIKSTSPDMRYTIDNYFDSLNVYDVQVVSTLGLTVDDVTTIKEIDNVENAYGSYSKDCIINIGEKEIVSKIMSITNDINKIVIIDGRMPENNEECIVEKSFLTNTNKKIGDTILIEEDLKDDEESFYKQKEVRIVGTVKSPLYISRERGTTNLGDGKISYYIYVPESNINSEVYTEIYVIAKNAKEIVCDTKMYDDYISEIVDDINEIKEFRQNARYDSLIGEANQKFDDAQLTLDREKSDANNKISDAEKKIEEGKTEIESGEKEIENNTKKADKEFADAELKLKNAEKELDIRKKEFENKKQEAEKGFTDAENKKLELQTNLSQLEDGIMMLQISLLEIDENIDFASKGGMIEQVEVLKIQKLTIENTISKYTNQKSQIVLGIKEIDNKISSGKLELENAEKQISSGYSELEKNRKDLEKTKTETYSKLRDAKKTIEDSKTELQNAEIELNEKKEEADQKIKDAENKLIDSRQKVSDIENPTWYIFDRTGNTGYNSYIQDIDSIAALGSLFPIVFFVIATLISLTTMTRMVEEQRTLIGTYKALGYNNMQIAIKYILYSSLATILGGIFGCIIGFQTLPRIIYMMYTMMYTITDLYVEFNTYYAFIGIIIISVCIIGATIYSVFKELRIQPAELMRPKAPKIGKRVFLEKIPFLWNRFDFIQKVTVRNMFRYKKRFLMTVIGICGCTALILAGFGIKDSISNILDYQYGKIYSYDMLISIKDSVKKEEKQQFISDLNNKEEIENVYENYMSSATLENNNKKQDVNLIVPKDALELKNTINFYDVKTGKQVELNNESIIITDKLSELLDVSIGDTIKYIDADNNETKVKVGGIVEHYLLHYVYMTKGLYEKIYKKDFESNVLFTKNKILTSEEEDNLSSDILKDSKVMAISKTSSVKGIMDDTFKMLNYVVIILIISAGLLAFVVLYNLANINISERIRELATIKVLGFYDKEVYNYVTREIIVLTVIGIILGLGFGYILTRMILVTCEINSLRFANVILLKSYLYSVIITVIFTIIVNFITYFSLKKIDMIEALKSIE